MPQLPIAANTAEGVLYAPKDYAGFLKRLMILVIDLGVILVALPILTFLVMVLWPPTTMDSAASVVILCWLGFTWGYLTILESSSIGTLGFLLTGAKIVNERGERPSVLRMTFRLGLWVFAPINVLSDLIWLAGNERKQTLRDTVAGTYVIRRRARPAGHGKLKLVILLFCSLNLAYYEVQQAGKS